MRQLRSILLAGGAGFIGSALARHLLRVEGLETLIVLDKLTCPGNRGNLIGPDQDPRVHFVEGDIQDRELTGHLLREHDITGVFNLAAETHSGRPLDSPVDFVHPNVLGTSRLLETCRVSGVPLLQCSTSKVYGQVSAPNRAVEINPLNPSTPYTASKASADLFCLAAARSHGQDIIITRSTSNYGPREHPEKLVPSLVHAAFHDLPVPIRGEGTQSRDWIHVDDHCRGMIAAFSKGQPGAVYLLGDNVSAPNWAWPAVFSKSLENRHPSSRMSPNNQSRMRAMQWISARQSPASAGIRRNASAAVSPSWSAK